MTYKELIESTIVPSTWTEAQQLEAYNKLSEYISTKVPPFLYRFRTCSEQNFDSFYRDEVYFASGDKMNDDFEARIYIDFAKTKEWLNSFGLQYDGKSRIEQIMESDIAFEQIRTIPHIEYALNILKQVPKDDLRNVSNKIVHDLSADLENELFNISAVIQSQTKFSCFTEKIASDMMWGKYAFDATGFALAYDFRNQLFHRIKSGASGEYQTGWNLFPIIYGNKRIDATSYSIYFYQNKILKSVAPPAMIPYLNNIINYIVPCPDVFMATKVAIKKSTDWCKEKEWRLFLVSPNGHSVTIRPSAVYLGRKVSPIHQKFLMDIAREKSIPVYKMDINNVSMSYKLKSIRIM